MLTAGPTVGQDRAVDIAEIRLLTYRSDRRKAGAAPATVNRELSALRRAFNLARKAKIVANVPDFEFLEEHNTRTGFFTDEEVRHCSSGCRTRCAHRSTSHTSRAVPSVDACVVRRGDDSARGRRDEEREGPTLPLRPGPGGEGDPGRTAHHQRRDHHPRDGAAVTVDLPPLERCAHRRLLESLDAGVQGGKLAGRLVHDLRRSAVRNLTRAGAPRRQAMAVTVHLTESVFNRYDITDDQDVKAAIAKAAAARAISRENGDNSGTISVIPPKQIHTTP